MDLGSVQAAGTVILMSADASAPGAWGWVYLNNTTLERSNDGVNWTTVGTVSIKVDGVQILKNVSASTRYLRVRKTKNYIGVGSFYAKTL